MSQTVICIKGRYGITCHRAHVFIIILVSIVWVPNDYCGIFLLSPSISIVRTQVDI